MVAYGNFKSGNFHGYNFVLETSYNFDGRNYSAANYLAAPVILQVGKTLKTSYAIRGKNLKTGNPDYIAPLRCKITISDKDQMVIFHEYDSFLPPEYNDLHILQAEVSLGLGQAGTFTLTLENSNDDIDRTIIGNGCHVLIQAGKTQDQYQDLLSGYVRRSTVSRPDTNHMLYILSGYSSQIRFNERITNFSRAAKRENFASNIPRRNDEDMTTAELFKDLVRDQDHLPIGEPPENFGTAGVEDEVHEFVPSIDEHLTQWSSVANVLAEGSGAIWGVDARDNIFLRYPFMKQAELTIKDVPDTTNDRADVTAYNIGPWEFTDSIDQGDGFANRLYGRGGSVEIASTSQSLGDSFQSLYNKALAVKFRPGSPRLSNIALMLSKQGSPSADKLLGSVVLDKNNTPTGVKIAEFNVMMRDIEESNEAVFRIDISPFTRNQIETTKDHWIILYAVGEDENNTVRWHHDNDFTTAGRYSARRSPGTKAGEGENWLVSSTGPLYTYQFFDTQIHTTEASNIKSILKFGVIEDVKDAEWVLENEGMDRYLNAVLDIIAKPKRTYELQDITIPDLLVMPGMLCQIKDSKAKITVENTIPGEIVEVSYNFNASENGLGTRHIKISPVAYVELPAFQFDPDEEIGTETTEDVPPFPQVVGKYLTTKYKILHNQDPNPCPGCGGGGTDPPPDTDGSLDPLGIKKIYRTTTDIVGGVKGREWFSTSWLNKKKRLIHGMLAGRDPYDPELQMLGVGTAILRGEGTMLLTGIKPRLYLYDKRQEKRWLNTEITIYGQRIVERWPIGFAGINVGARSNHQSIGRCPCNGATYMGRLTYDGRACFSKEIVHGARYGYTSERPIPVVRNWWPGPLRDMPTHQWHGLKFICRTRNATNTVKFELWRDLTDGLNGGDWHKLVEYEDVGGWTNPSLTLAQINKACSQGCVDKPSRVDPIFIRPGVSIFLRNDGLGTFYLKNFSSREINPIR